MNLRAIGMIISSIIIILMLTIMIKTNFQVKEKTSSLEEYPSGLIEDQVDGQASDVVPDFGLEINEVAPDFKLKNLSGEEVKLSDYRGKKVFLNFWASWCPPCKVEMPYMESYYKKYKETMDIEIIAVNMTSDERKFEIVEAFVNSHGLTFPVLLDDEGEVKDLYKILAYPTTYMVNADGVIVDRFSKSIDETMIKELFDSMK